VIPAAPTAEQPPRHAGRIVEIVQTVLTALLLALVFRTFFVEPFIIPTGSMAETLRGAHARQLCRACGWTFDFGPAEPGAPTGEDFVTPARVKCPNCQLETTPAPEDCLPRAGDRLLVEKWTYATGLRTPQRWDVIVFRDANAPQQHLIKRAVGLPGESIELRDGDVFIDGRIARKPRHVQDALWTVVYAQPYAPHIGERSAGPRWVADANGASGWTGIEGRVLRHDADARDGVIAFRASSSTDYFRDLLGYNRRSDEHFVGDLRVRFELAASRDGALACTLERPGPDVTLLASAPGRHVFEVRVGDAPEAPNWSAEWSEDGLLPATPVQVEFAFVDRRAYLAVNGRVVIDSGTTLDDLPARVSRDEPIGVLLRASHACELRGLRIDRDVYYSRSSHTRRATPGDPFTLGQSEFFVLGDNSADSHDSREWAANVAGPYGVVRAGTVRREQIVGQANFVYLPAMLPLDGRGTFRMLDLGQTRFVR
jgi:signal peptidase I